VPIRSFEDMTEVRGLFIAKGIAAAMDIEIHVNPSYAVCNSNLVLDLVFDGWMNSMWERRSN
jgi:hypothetical protein